MTTTNTAKAESAAAARDFQFVHTLGVAPEAVLAALTSAEGIASWWGPTLGPPSEGERFVVGFGGEKRIDLDVVAARPDRVEWLVDSAPHTPDWDGTTIAFELTPE